MEVESTDALYDFYGWLHKNWKRVVAGAIVAAVIAAIVTFVVWSHNEKEAGANQRLLAVPSLIGEAPAGDPASASALLKISEDDSGTSAGAIAQLLAAKELFLSGKYAEAQQAFSKFVADHSAHPLAPQASVGIAASLEAQGKVGDAVQQYKKINVLYPYSSYPNIDLPVKLTLGRLSEADNKLADAVQAYKELASLNDPNDPWVVEAYERLRLLLTKHPELNPAPPQATSTAPPSSLLTPSDTEMQLLPPPGSAPVPTPPPVQGTNTQVGGTNPPASLVPSPPPPAPPQVTAPAPVTEKRDLVNQALLVPPPTNQNLPTIPPATNSTPAGRP